MGLPHVKILEWLNAIVLVLKLSENVEYESCYSKVVITIIIYKYIVCQIIC